MITNTTYSSLESLLENHKDHKAYKVICLVPQESGEKFLLDAVISRVQKDLGKEVDFECIEDPAATTIRKQLKVKKLPVILLLASGKIESIYEGMIGSTQLKSIINQLTTKERNPLSA